MYKDLSLKEKAKVLLYGGKLGLTSVEDIAKLYDDAISHKFAEGSMSTPDWDPNNPYHYHTASGEKVVITPEDWEKHYGQPYFKQVLNAVEAELAAHPGPEYVINPLFSEDLRRVYKGNMGPSYQNYSSFSSNLPQGYSFTPEGLVLDNQGNLYVLKGFRQTPRFTYDENNPLVFPVLEGRNQGNVKFYPVNMEKTIKPSLPISSIMNVDKEHESAIRKAQNQYEYPVTLWDILPTGEGVISTYDNVYSTSPYYGDDYSKNYHPYKDKGAKQFFENYISNIIGREIKLNGPSYMWDDNGNFRDVYADDIFNLSPKEFNIVKKKLKDAKNKDYKFEKNKTEENLNKYKQEGLLIGDDEEVYRNSIKSLEDWISQDNPWLWGDEDRSPKPRKISRKEAEKKAVIEVGPLQVGDVLTYAQGGPIVSPYGQWKYPGRDTIIPSNNITMDNVNYPVLGISDAGDVKVMMPWNDYKFRGSMVYEHPLIGNQFQLGGNTKPTFDLWYPTVPEQKNDTSSYDLRRAYNALPFDEMEKFRTINDYHLPSVAYDEKTDTYTFLKRNGHPTLNYELDWYNSGSPDALEFRERYKLDTLSLPWRYIPRTYLKGGNTQNYLNIPEYNIALYNTVSPLGDFPNFWGALAYRRLVKDKLKNGNIYERDYKVGDTLGEKTAMAAWAKRLGIPYNELDLPVYNGDTVTLPYSLVLEIPYDTNVLKNRIQLNKALLDKYSKYRYSDVVDAAIKADLYNLDKLRETYKTGKPVGLTEFGWNSRLLVDNGEIVPIENIQSPLNVLGNYNVRYSPEERRLYYSDEYDFNQFENFVPGEPYRIRGYIDLDNNKALGGNLFATGGPKKKLKSPEEILAEKYGVEPMVADNTNIVLNPVFTPLEKSYATALQAFYERHKSQEAEEKASREARQAVKDLKAAEFGTLDTPLSNNLQYAWRRFNNSKGTELLYPLPVIGEAMFGVDIADKLYGGNYGDAVKDLALYGAMTYAPEIKQGIKTTIKPYWNTNIAPKLEEGLMKLTHPSYQKVYHGTPIDFDITKFHSSAREIGLHVAPQKDIAKGFTSGIVNGLVINNGVVKEFYVPKPKHRTVDLHTNGLNLLSDDYVFLRGIGDRFNNLENIRYGLDFNVKDIDLLEKAGFKEGKDFLLSSSGLYTPDKINVNNWQKSPNFRYAVAKDDLHINPREIIGINDNKLSLLIDNLILLYDEAKILGKLNMIDINNKAGSLLYENGIPTMGYWNHNPVEGALWNYIVTDPRAIKLPKYNFRINAFGGDLFSKGGSIHIKPKNRGKFTALKKRTGHSASWFKAHGTPALKKMATFELNSRHWNKHDEGGYLYSEGGFLLAPYLYNE